jgi:predicted esterase
MKAAIVLLHGRGASAEDILGLREELDFADVEYLAPQAQRARLESVLPPLALPGVAAEAAL